MLFTMGKNFMVASDFGNTMTLKLALKGQIYTDLSSFSVA